MELFERTYRLTFTDELLGTMPGNKEIFADFVAKRAETLDEETEAIPMDAETALEKGTTVFPRTAQGEPFIYDYQIRGFFKEACKFLKKVSDTKSSKEKAYKQKWFQGDRAERFKGYLEEEYKKLRDEFVDGHTKFFPEDFEE